MLTCRSAIGAGPVLRRQPWLLLPLAALLLGFARPAVAGSGVDSAGPAVYRRTIAITYPDSGRFVEFLEANGGDTVEIRSRLDMSVSSPESYAIADLFGIRRFMEDSGTPVPLSPHSSADGSACFLVLDLLDGGGLKATYGGTGVVQFPLEGLFRVERAPDADSAEVWRLVEVSGL
jgi:hypothetical protein